MGETGGEGRTQTEIQSGLEKIVAENVSSKCVAYPEEARNGGNTTEAYAVGG